MFNAEIDLLDGQLSKFDRVPVNYSSPYNTNKTPAEPTYEKLNSHREKFLDPNTFSYDSSFMSELQQFIYTQQPVYVYPTNIDNGVYIGAGHKLDPIEIANNMMAYRNSGFLPLNDDAVQKVVEEKIDMFGSAGKAVTRD